jgi:hypothetical protein
VATGVAVAVDMAVPSARLTVAPILRAGFHRCN